MPGRRGRPGLLATVSRTAVIAGTAQVTANAVNRRASRAEATPPSAPPPTRTSAPPSTRTSVPMSAGEADAEVDLVGALSQLARLFDSGALTEAEFQTAKSRLLS